MSPSSSVSRHFGVIASFTVLAACEYHIGDHDADSWSGAGGAGGRDTPLVCTTGETPACREETPLPRSCGVKVDRWKELMVVHRSVLLDRRAQNEVAGAEWSFRSQMETLSGSTEAAAAFTSAWLGQWKTLTSVGPDRAPVVPRPGVEAAVLHPWQASGGSLATVPFRLLAIVNRPDLRDDDTGCAGSGGELRFVYTATDGERGEPIAMTAIIEIPYPRTRSAREWMDAWHAVARAPFGPEYNDALATLTARVRSEAKPETWRVRTNERAFGEPGGQSWELREFALSSSGPHGSRLEQSPLATTPRLDLDRSRSLDSWAEENEQAIKNGSYVLPSGFQAGAATVARADFRWSSSTMSPETRAAFSMATCNGCHGGERGEASLPFQHIAAPPRVTGDDETSDDETRLSTWLNDPSGRGDELSRRERSVARALCGTCATSAGTGYPR